MGIFSRLGDVINSYISDFVEDRPSKRQFPQGDPDFDAAFDELNDFLNRKDPSQGGSSQERSSQERRAQQDWSAGVKLPPEELRPDFECLGVPFGAGADECKAAYKKLLKIHHPDRHAGHEGNFKKATEKSARINAAWDRIEKWRKGVT